MDKSAIMQRVTEALSPFETENVVQFLRHLTVKSAIENPWFVGVFLIMAFYAVIVRSKFVLSVLFTASALLLLIHFTMPTDGGSLSLSSTLPFAFGSLAIGAVIIYLYFIKTE
jgi:hypothetical protein